MREIVDEDIGSGVRLITRYCLNTTGVERSVRTEKFDPNLVNSSSDEDDDVKDIVYDNFQNITGIENYGNIVYDKVVTTLADGTKLYSFNEKLGLTFKETFDCDDNSYVDDVFYIDHNVSNCRITRFLFREISPYDEGSRIEIYINDNLEFDQAISDLTYPADKKYNYPFFEFPIEFERFYGTRTKWQIFIVGNKSTGAYGKLYVEFESLPPNAIMKNDIINNLRS